MNGACTLTNVNSGKVLSVCDGSHDNGAKLQQLDNPDSTHSQWKLERMHGNVHTLRNVNSGKVLNVDGGSHDNGAKI